MDLRSPNYQISVNIGKLILDEGHEFVIVILVRDHY